MAVAARSDLAVQFARPPCLADLRTPSFFLVVVDGYLACSYLHAWRPVAHRSALAA